MGDKSTEIRLLELFDELSKSFYGLMTSYEKLKNDIIGLSNTSQNIKDIKTSVNDIEKDLRTTNQISQRLENLMNDLIAYKNNIKDIPDETINEVYELKILIDKLKTKLEGHDSTSSDAIKLLLKTFNDEFIQSVKNLGDINVLIKNLEPVTKFTKLVSTPLGIVILFISITLGIMGASFGLYKTVQLFAPDQTKLLEKAIQKIEQKNNIVQRKLKGSNGNLDPITTP